MGELIETLVLTSAKPGDHFFAELETQLDCLRPCAEAEKVSAGNREPDFSGSQAEVVEKIRTVITRDWRENSAEDLPCSFEYQLLRVVEPIDQIAIRTRLFHPSDPQSIFYGSKVVRVSKSEFAAWISE